MIKKINLSFFIKIFIFFVIITSLIISITIFTTQQYLKFLEKKITERYTNSLFDLAYNIDNELTETKNEVFEYIWSDEFNNLRKSKNPEIDFINGNKKLGAKIYSNIHSIFYIYNNKKIITKNNIKKYDSFFNYHYIDLNENEIPILNRTNLFELSKPLYFKENDLKESTVIPYYILDSSSNNLNNKILINLNVQKITYLLSKFLLTDNSIIFLMDADGNIITTSEYCVYYNKSKKYSENSALRFKENYLFNPSSKSYINKIDNRAFLEKIKKQKTFRSKFFKDKRLIIALESSEIRNNINNIYYVASIPYKDLYLSSFPVPFGIISILISILCLVLSLFFSFLLSRNLYSPIKNIVNIFRRNNKKLNENEFDYINKNLTILFTDKKRLTEDFSKALPIIVENYIYKVLNENIDFNEKEFKYFLNKQNISFKYNSFITAVVRINFKIDFYEKFNYEDQLDIISEAYKLIKKTFSKMINVYVVSISKSEACIIYNVSKSTEVNDIYISLEKIINMLNQDLKYIQSMCGIGRKKQNLQGLKESYEEANKAIKLLPQNENNNIIIYTPDSKKLKHIIYTLDDEKKLINLIFSGLKVQALQLIKEIFNKNIEKGISQEEEHELYLRIYYTLIRILNQKSINIKELLKDHYKDLPKIHTTLTSNEIKFYLTVLIDKISELNNYKGKFNINAVIEYIDNNFSTDISFENTSELFNISSPHLSRLLKRQIGKSFQEYINSLRIHKSKDYLQRTSKGIDEISGLCGFNSRFTFIRMFKQIEGITPTQYRILSKDLRK